MLVSRRYCISGIVQGVGYRFFTKEMAEKEKVCGFARNLQDGRVEVLAEGEKDAMTEFERALWSGPGGAFVDSVSVEEVVSEGLRRFEIRP